MVLVLYATYCKMLPTKILYACSMLPIVLFLILFNFIESTLESLR